MTFLVVYLLGIQLYPSEWVFRGLEFLWMGQVIVIANNIQHSQRDLFFLALIGLSPGLVNNVLLVLQIAFG